MSVKELLDRDRIVAVSPDRKRALRLLAEANRHLASAGRIASEDQNGAYVLLYDAARKAVTAHMAAGGLRVRARPGAHEVIGLYAEAALADGVHPSDVRDFDRMRRSRNRTEYDAWWIDEPEVRADLERARAIVTAVEGALASSPAGDRADRRPSPPRS